MYVILALVFLAIGAWDIGPMVDSLDERNMSTVLKSVIMILILGGVPASIIGVALIGDTMWGKNKR